jgi:hypothetical protein
MNESMVERGWIVVFHTCKDYWIEFSVKSKVTLKNSHSHKYICNIFWLKWNLFYAMRILSGILSSLSVFLLLFADLEGNENESVSLFRFSQVKSHTTHYTTHFSYFIPTLQLFCLQICLPSCLHQEHEYAILTWLWIWLAPWANRLSACCLSYVEKLFKN